MTNKTFNQGDKKPLDYYKALKAAQKQDKPNNDLVSALRSDLIPASRAEPAEESIFKREYLKIALGILLGIIIIGLSWYALAGSGRPILEQKLISLAHKEITSTPLVDPSPMPVTNTPPQPSSTTTPSPTSQPTSTPAKKILISPTLKPTLVPPTPVSSCRDALTITLADVGQTLCVQGIVIETITKPNNFMVVFSHQRGAFYWVSYDLDWSKAELKTCYQVQGKIEQIGISPMLIFNYNNLPEECP